MHAFAQLIFRARDYTTAIRDFGASEDQWNRVVNEAIAFHDTVRANSIFGDVSRSTVPERTDVEQFVLYWAALLYVRWWFRAGEHGLSLDQWNTLATQALTMFTDAVMGMEPWEVTA